VCINLVTDICVTVHFYKFMDYVSFIAYILIKELKNYISIHLLKICKVRDLGRKFCIGYFNLWN